MQRTLLLVDDESNIISSLKRLFYRNGYQIITAPGAAAAFEMLAQHEVGVILSDFRMPGMTGIEFLHIVKERYPDTVRIILSGFSDIALVTDAINRGAVYKFLTKPWEDDLLLANVEEAFMRYEMRQENVRLANELGKANELLRELNVELQERVLVSTNEATKNRYLLELSQHVLEALPVGVLGVDDEGMVVVVNQAARRIFQLKLSLARLPEIGEMADQAVPKPLLGVVGNQSVTLSVRNGSITVQCWKTPLLHEERVRGDLLVFVQTGESAG